MMHASSIGIRSVNDDVRLPTFISIPGATTATPSSRRSPIRSTAVAPAVVTPDRRGAAAAAAAAALKSTTSKRTQSTMFTSIIGPSSPTISSSTYRQTNVLVQLCEKQQWNEVCIRCQSHPEEAIPMPMGPVFTHASSEHTTTKSSSLSSWSPPTKRERKNSHVSSTFYNHSSSCSGGGGGGGEVHSVTPLGMACQSDFETSDKMLGVVQKLLEACPAQVRSNHGVAGHTPLRDAIRNRAASPQVIAALLRADRLLSGPNRAIYRRDRDGLSPVDHCIVGVHAGIPHSLESLQMCISTRPDAMSQENEYDTAAVSPLIRLLSMGTSFGLHSRGGTTTPRKDDSNRTARVLECARCLMIAPEMALPTTTTQSTKCTPLHVAIRNYGNVLSLIQLLLESDAEEEQHRMMVRERNLYGDLPLHVACSVGVPLDVLRLVLQHTPPDEIWSVNQSGYTPVDLEWMRHIEGGRGFYEVRSFYPLEASGIRNQGTQQDKFYKALLQEAVDQVMTTTTRTTNSHATSSSSSVKNAVLGVLLDRIVLIVQVAHDVGRLDQPPSRLTDGLLHAASALSRVPGPTLPTPLLRLFAWMYPDQIGQMDQEGRLPLHHALMPPTTTTTTTAPNQQQGTTTCRSTRDGSPVDRVSWIKLLLDRLPRSAMVADHALRLPLHYALDSRTTTTTCNDETQQGGGELEQEWNGVIQKLVEAFPDSVDRRDPTTQLFPFLQAAQDPYSSTETAFYLLRRNPTLVQGGIRE